MIIHSKNEHINVNDSLDTYIKKQYKKYKLRKIAASLSVAGSIFLVASCANNFASKPLEEPTIIADTVNSLFDNNDITNNYNSSYRYLYHFGHSDDEGVRLTARVDYVDSSRAIENDIKNLVKDDIREITGTEGEIFFKQNNTDGDYYINGAIVLKQKDLPPEIVNFISEIITIESYNGTGESDIWNKKIDKYSILVNDAIKDANEIHNTNYEYKDGKIVNVQKTH